MQKHLIIFFALLNLSVFGEEKKISITDIISNSIQDINSLDNASKNNLLNQLKENKNRIIQDEEELSNFLIGYLLCETKKYDEAYQYLKIVIDEDFALSDYREYFLIISRIEKVRKNKEENLDEIDSILSSLSLFGVKYPESLLKNKILEKIASIEKKIALLYLNQNNPKQAILFLKRIIARTSEKALKKEARVIMACAFIMLKKFNNSNSILRALLFEGLKKDELSRIAKSHNFDIGAYINKIEYVEKQNENERIEAKGSGSDLYSPDGLNEIFDKFNYHNDKMNYVVLPVLLKQAISEYKDRDLTEKMIKSFNEVFEKVVEKSYKDKTLNPVVNEYISTYSYYDSTHFIKFADEIIKKSYYKETLKLLLFYIKKYSTLQDADKLKYYIARLYEDTGELDNSLKYYEMIVNGHPNSAFFERALFKKGWILYRKKDFESAIKIFSDYYNQFKYDEFKTPSYYFTAKSYELLGKKREAEDVYNELIQKYPITFYAILARMNLKKSIEELFKVSKDIKKDDDYLFEDQIYLDKATGLIKCHLLSFAKMELERVTHYNKPAEFNLSLSKLNSIVQNYQKSLLTAKYIKTTGDYFIAKSTAMLLYPLYYQDIIKKYNTFNIDEYFILSLINQESLFQKDISSQSNAVGLMQLILDTARRESGNSNMSLNDLKNPETNIDTGIKYLNNLIKRFNGNRAYVLSAYNAGEHNVERWRSWAKDMDVIDYVEAIPYKETRGYVKIVMSNYLMYNYLYNNREFKNITEWFNINNPTLQIGVVE